MKISPFIFPLFSLRTVSVWSKNNPPEDNDGCDPCGLRDAENTFENFAFQTEVPNALSPGFKYVPDSGNRFTVDIGMATNHEPGFTFTSSTGNNIPAQSTIYGYGVDGEYTWPGKTFEVNRGVRYEVTWRNKIYPGPYILTGKGDYCEDSVVDTSLHWAYSVTAGSFEVDGVPIVTHLHGGHTDSLNDGNPEFYYNYDETVVGPQYVTSTYTYEDNIDATSLWYHDHALGITRLNVYAGLAGFYFVRDPSSDSGKWPNRLNLPVYPYEVALAIQDRMFKNACSRTTARCFTLPFLAILHMMTLLIVILWRRSAKTSLVPQHWRNSSAITWWLMGKCGPRRMSNLETIDCAFW
jgi:hypothetical protein